MRLNPRGIDAMMKPMIALVKQSVQTLCSRIYQSLTMELDYRKYFSDDP